MSPTFTTTVFLLLGLLVSCGHDPAPRELGQTLTIAQDLSRAWNVSVELDPRGWYSLRSGELPSNKALIWVGDGEGPVLDALPLLLRAAARGYRVHLVESAVADQVFQVYRNAVGTDAWALGGQGPAIPLILGMAMDSRIFSGLVLLGESPGEWRSDLPDYRFLDILSLVVVPDGAEVPSFPTRDARVRTRWLIGPPLAGFLWTGEGAPSLLIQEISQEIEFFMDDF